MLRSQNRISLLTLIVVISFFGFNIASHVKALYYSQPSSDIPESAFMVMELKSGNYGTCGLNYLEPGLAITAAHCLRNANYIYANTGNYSKVDFFNTAIESDNFVYSSEHSPTVQKITPAKGDIGIIKFNTPVTLNNYAKVASPIEGCGYYLVGYGLNENDEDLSRRGTDVCIKNLTDYSFEIQHSDKSHFCNGDSGSGIYRKGTNDIVGLVSLYIMDATGKGCTDGLVFVAARADYNLNFINQHTSTTLQPTATLVPIQPTALPNNYLNDYYPELGSDQSGYNINDDVTSQKIDKMVEDLIKTFEEIYPEGELTVTVTTTPTQTITPTLYNSLPLQTPAPTIGEIVEPGVELSDETIEAIVVLCCCCLFGFGATGVIIFILIRKKRSAKQQPNIIAEQTNRKVTSPVAQPIQQEHTEVIQDDSSVPTNSI